MLVTQMFHLNWSDKTTEEKSAILFVCEMSNNSCNTSFIKASLGLSLSRFVARVNFVPEGTRGVAKYLKQVYGCL